MYLTNVKLDNFRNYHRLALDLPQGSTLLVGDNAQGKTNLLEAVFFLATTRATFARSEQQVINWEVFESEPLPFARVEGHVQRRDDRIKIDITVLPGENGHVRKELRINGAKKRALDVVGQLNAVLFVPEDIDLITGAPAGRRRYMDITLCQIDPVYCRTLSQYNHTMTQRNALLKQLGERRGNPDELLFWDQRLAALGAVVIARRQTAMTELGALAGDRYHQLTGGEERLRLFYLPSFDPDRRPVPDFSRPHTVEDTPGDPRPTVKVADIETAFAAELKRARREEIARGMTVIGPHRDDIHFLVDGIDVNIFGSRGQQRTAALGTKLAEVDLMTRATGEPPVLLLDDVMSELDERRRANVIAMVTGVEQAVLTTTDLGNFPEFFRERAGVWRVAAGGLCRP